MNVLFISKNIYIWSLWHYRVFCVHCWHFFWFGIPLCSTVKCEEIQGVWIFLQGTVTLSYSRVQSHHIPEMVNWNEIIKKSIILRGELSRCPVCSLPVSPWACLRRLDHSSLSHSLPLSLYLQIECPPPAVDFCWGALKLNGVGGDKKITKCSE